MKGLLSVFLAMLVSIPTIRATRFGYHQVGRLYQPVNLPLLMPLDALFPSLTNPSEDYASTVPTDVSTAAESDPLTEMEGDLPMDGLKSLEEEDIAKLFAKAKDFLDCDTIDGMDDVLEQAGANGRSGAN